MKKIIISSTLALLFTTINPVVLAANIKLLNVSYDPTRELYQEFNEAFAKHWKAQTGDDVAIKQSHGGSGKQVRAIIDGSGSRRRDTSSGLRCGRIAKQGQFNSG